MSENLKIMSEIESTVTYAESFAENFTTLTETMTNISNTFAEGTWKGESAEKAQEIHSLIVQYLQELQTHSTKLQTITQQLCTDVDNFSSVSDNVISITGW